MSNKIKHEIETIEIPGELHDRAKQGVKQSKAEMSLSKRLIGNRAVTFSTAVIIVFSLLIGSTFVSPTMSAILAKVPFLSNITASEPIEKVMTEELNELGFKVHRVDESPYPKKIMYVAIDGTETYYEDVKSEVKKEAEDILQAHSYDAFSVKTERYNRDEEIVTEDEMMEDLSEETKQYVNESNILMEEIHQKFEEKGFSIPTFGVRHNQYDHYVTVDVPDTEKRTAEIKQIIRQVIDSKDFGEFDIKLNIFNKERKELEMAISSKVISPLHEGLRARKEFHTKGMAYSFHPLPLQIIVKTTIDSSDKDAKEIAEEIETTVEEFLATEEIQKVMKDEPYKIIVRSSDQKKIN
ncbi:DUF4030 domain-containing protein [Virgibacillus indicus]|nr:DUF4030 domain-containing protein [Virgibacillus indicus]